MKWKKIANIEPLGLNRFWECSHLANPVIKIVGGKIWRIYCNTRDKRNRAYLIYIDLDPNNGFNVVGSSDTPLLSLGLLGAFDDAGISMGSIYTYKEYDYLYYLGWNLGKGVPFRNAIGLAVSKRNQEAFKKISIGPLLDRNIVDPFSISYPFVIRVGDKYKMWYGSHKQWGSTTDDMIHCIKYAESNDLINWSRSGEICLDTNNQHYAFSKPFVLLEGDIYKMWYSYRGDKYRIGYAESQDGIHWERMDHLVGIDVSPSGWDSEMIEYPCVFDYEGDRYMLYNGNGYGKTGFGIAVLEKD